MILVDSNIIFDVLDNDPQWCAWSGAQLQRWAQLDRMTVNAIVYAEISPRYRSEAKVDELLKELKLDLVEIPRSAAFLAGKAHFLYRQRGGAKKSILADFFIGAHATVLGSSILTRDIERYTTYFPTVPLIAP
ncbi:MAG TPA: type II toxin-antitoxin system VapC family toxin [Terracidiphilus sp.]|nr:type II toxin-antitoxin system VapC family toxin [Terracidiphilus sp.]